MESRLDKRSMGFGADIAEKKDAQMDELLAKVMPQDLVKFGIIPEFIGRVPVTVSLKSLDVPALVRIMKEPKNAIIKQYQKLFELDGVNLTFTDEAIQAIAEKSYKRKTGARGLRAIMESIMLDVMFEIPSDESIIGCTITKEVVEDGVKPLVKR